MSTAPVTKDDIVMGCVKMLSGHASVLSVVGMTPPELGDSVPMLFGYSMWNAQFEGSQQTACFITCDGGWAGPNEYNTMRFPRIGLNIWADPVRDGRGNESDPGEVMRRLDRAYEVIDDHLHRPQGGSQMWGSIRTVSCARLTEPATYRLSDGDGIVRLIAYYAVSQG